MKDSTKISILSFVIAILSLSSAWRMNAQDNEIEQIKRGIMKESAEVKK